MNDPLGERKNMPIRRKLGFENIRSRWRKRLSAFSCVSAKDECPGPRRPGSRRGWPGGPSGTSLVLHAKGYPKQLPVLAGMVVLAVSLIPIGKPIANAQTCGCAEAPLMSSLDTPATAAGSWQFGLTYQYNSIDVVVSGSKELKDRFSERSSRTLLLETSYGFSPAWSVTAMIAAVEHERRNKATGGASSDHVVRTRGVGDGLVLLKYNVTGLRTGSPRELTLGGGLKLPLGRTDLTSQGIILAEDMQPGTGSWDGIFWGYASQGSFPTATSDIFLSASYRLTGTSDREYRFGNEFITNIGVRHRPWSSFDYSLAVRYRRTEANRRSGSEIPNTGGKWIYFAPGLNVRLSDNLSLRFSGQIPIDRDLNGTQLTNSLTASVSLFYLLR